MVNLWQSGRDGMQGAFLQPIAGLWAKKATQQTARDRLITEHTELFRGSLGWLQQQQKRHSARSRRIQRGPRPCGPPVTQSRVNLQGFLGYNPRPVRGT